MRPGVIRFLGAEDGIALMLAIVVMMVVTIMAVSAAALITSTQNTASNERQGQRAFTAGDAGLTLGADQVTAAWDSSDHLPSTPAEQHMSGSATVDGSPVSWTADYDPTAGTWTVTAT